MSSFGGGGCLTGSRSLTRFSSREFGQYPALANRYRHELKSGMRRSSPTALSMVAPFAGFASGRVVHGCEDGREHLHAEEVAVDASTHKPVYMRWTEDGRPVKGPAS